MSQGDLVSVVTNAAFAALAFVWVFICIALWTRRRRPLHIAGALFSAIMTIIFLIRTLALSGRGLLSEDGALETIRWLWLAGVLIWCVYSTVFLMERLRRPGPEGAPEGALEGESRANGGEG